MSDFEMRMEEWPSTLSPEIRQNMLDSFMTRSYKMLIKVKNQSEDFVCSLKVTDLKKETDYKYQIKFTGKD